MYITKICYMSCRLTFLIDKLDKLDNFDYSYRSIEGGDEVEVEVTKGNLKALLKLEYVSKQDHDELIKNKVDSIFFY